MARKYTASESASGWTKLGKARRKITKIKRKTAIVQGAASMAASVAAFGMGQAKKAKTAWGEYEAGYKELGGTESIERPKIGKGYFKGPEGEVQIGGSLYDRGQIQKAGSFLGSDAAAVLTPEMREQYLGRTAPGRDISSIALGKPSSMPSSAGLAVTPTTSPSWPSQEYTQPVVRTPQEEAELEANRKIKEQQLAVRRKRGYLGTNWQDEYKDIMNEDNKNPQGLKPKVTVGALQDISYAHGGDFITNGPQKILVGDNPGGRERVTIRPLDSEDTKGYYGKAHNWLEALYANNERRKKY